MHSNWSSQCKETLGSWIQANELFWLLVPCKGNGEREGGREGGREGKERERRDVEMEKKEKFYNSNFTFIFPLLQLKEELHSILPPPSIRSTFPVIYRQRIYFMSSISHRSQFVADPESFLSQEVPRLPVPMCLAIVGPPKSGKTTSMRSNGNSSHGNSSWKFDQIWK